MVTFVLSSEVGAAEERPSGGNCRLIFTPVPLRLLRMRSEPLRVYSWGLGQCNAEGRQWELDWKAEALMLLNPLEMLEAAAASAAVLAGGYAYASMWPASRIFGEALTAPHNAPGKLPEIALTFDDGPNQAWTPQLLDVLAEREVRATFFLIGQYAAVERDLVRRVHAAGHLIGNHTWTHPNLSRTGLSRTREELRRTSGEIEGITGAAVRFFRPPFGARGPWTFGAARELGLIPVTWNLIGNDWNAGSSQQILDRVVRLTDGNQRRGLATNLVLHDGSHRTPTADRSRSVEAARELLARYGVTHRFVGLDAWAG
jgi:peptidoglycan-N-acetylglucosamine deacetylase